VHILYFADIRFPLERANGIQTMETCHALAERGHTVHLAVRPDTDTRARDPFDFYGLPAQPRLQIERARVTGPETARRVGYLAYAAGRVTGSARADIVMTRDLSVASMLLQLPRAMRPPVVYESHGYAPDVSAALPDLVATAARPSPAKLRRLARREETVWRNADGYVTITAGLAEELRRRFGDRRLVAVIADGVRGADFPRDADHTYLPRDADPTDHTDLQRDADHTDHTDLQRHADRTDRHTIIVGYAGHLYPWKGVDVLLDALARVPDVEGLIVGGPDKEPDLDRLKARSAELGIDGRVTFTGLVPPPRVRALLGRADILVLPNPASAISTRYTSPLKLFEYMAAGRAIIASDLPAIREVLAHESTALLVAPGEPEALAAAIRRLRGDPALRTTLARAACAAAAEYSWGRRAERLEALFHEVTSGR
jgi:glycosyltransferase involved in cell wall biosynthesis